MERERVIEIFAGLLVIVFVLTLVFVVVGFNEQTINTSTVSNSYNVNSFNTYVAPTPRTSYVNNQPQYLTYESKPYIVANKEYPHTNKVYQVSRDTRYTRPTDSYLRYSDFGRHQVYRSVLGTPVDNYEVYVRNRDYIGGYFKVNFYFEDYYGKTNSYSVTHYVRPHAEQKFVFRDVSPDYARGQWRYKIVSQTKLPVKTYYNTHTSDLVYVGHIFPN